MSRLFFLPTVLAISCVIQPAHAETVACTPLTALPAVIEVPGTYCLAKGMEARISTGAAISIKASDVTLDCNGYRVNGSSAGATSTAKGVYAAERSNITIRGCTVKGFHTGIELSGSTSRGNRVEDNRVTDSLYRGIFVRGSGNLVRKNQVLNTGGFAGSGNSYGIVAAADVADNLVDGVFGAARDSYPRGIVSNHAGSVLSGNHVRNINPSGYGTALGIYVQAPGVVVDSNQVTNKDYTEGTGIIADTNMPMICRENVVARFARSLTNCTVNHENTFLTF